MNIVLGSFANIAVARIVTSYSSGLEGPLFIQVIIIIIINIIAIIRNRPRPDFVTGYYLIFVIIIPVVVGISLMLPNIIVSYSVNEISLYWDYYPDGL
jgi:hypothetical protein